MPKVRRHQSSSNGNRFAALAEEDERVATFAPSILGAALGGSGGGAGAWRARGGLDLSAVANELLATTRPALTPALSFPAAAPITAGVPAAAAAAAGASWGSSRRTDGAFQSGGGGMDLTSVTNELLSSAGAGGGAEGAAANAWDFSAFAQSSDAVLLSIATTGAGQGGGDDADAARRRQVNDALLRVAAGQADELREKVSRYDVTRARRARILTVLRRGDDYSGKTAARLEKRDSRVAARRKGK